ncbi:FAD-dependent oxidoreductase [Guyparkeria hydrothermalis]|uniref:FAD-dependent oxidoreductase n=1 Tax=Guyparkeria hydrothermalis TaxID=923 RepID=UPI00202169C2|nr:FAD-dependent oxidoreductase [Guyparkeria hydrothermalis]MCL7745441.1 FAD-dependent oxidoreductase [Guyparkeria hydrothermalis]
MAAAHHADVIVVGGGMVGAAAALALARRDFEVVLVEREPPAPLAGDDPFDLRVSALAPASIALLDRLGAWPAIRAERAALYRRMRVFDAVAPGDLTYEAAEIGRPYLGYIVENRRVQLALWEQLAGCDNVECLTGSVPQQLEVGERNARVTLSDGRAVTADLVIGADGQRSWIREAAGIGASSRDYAVAAQILSVETAYPQQDITWQRFTPDGPQAFLPLAGSRGSLVWYDAPERVRARHALSPTELRDEAIRHFPEELGEIDRVAGQAWFPIRRLHAHRYWAERVILVGDAAHSIHPLAGQGANLGFADVDALDALLGESDGHAPGAARLGRAYERRRRADNQLVQSLMDAFDWGYRRRDPVTVAARTAATQLVAGVPPLRRWMTRMAGGQRFGG